MTTEMMSMEQLEGIAGGDFIPPAATNPINPGIPCPRPYPRVELIRPTEQPTSIPASQIPQVRDFVPPATGKPKIPYIPCPGPIPYIEPLRPKEQHTSIPASKMFE